jgi:transposase
LAEDWVPAALQKLYRIEARAKAKAMGPEARLELRQREAKPIFVGLLIATMRQDVLPKSTLGKALGYAENEWPAMGR